MSTLVLRGADRHRNQRFFHHRRQHLLKLAPSTSPRTRKTRFKRRLTPGQAGEAHRHPGPAFVYVVEGTYELGIDDRPTKTYQASESFQEPPGALHRVTRNPAATGLIGFLVHPRLRHAGRPLKGEAIRRFIAVASAGHLSPSVAVPLFPLWLSYPPTEPKSKAARSLPNKPG